MVNAQLDDYWIAISSLGNRLKLFNPDKLKNYLTNHDEDIDFIKFCNEYITELKSEKREKSTANFKTVKNSLVDFFKREKVLAFIFSQKRPDAHKAPGRFYYSYFSI